MTRSQATAKAHSQHQAGLINEQEFSYILGRLQEIASGVVYNHAIGWRRALEMNQDLVN